MDETEKIILSHKKYAEFSIFSTHALTHKNSLKVTPFNNHISGDFIYLTNRKSARYSFLFDNLTENEVFHNCNITMGYTALLICEKIEYFENNELSFSKPIQGNSNENNLVDRFCIFQNPLNKLFEDDYHDIIGVYSDYETAKYNCDFPSTDAPILLAKIKAHLDWH